MPTCNNCGFDGTCTHCGDEVAGDYCTECGKAYCVQRMTVHSILHEVAHFYTHFEKGFIYTLHQLSTRPGQMQKYFLEGHRTKHQKPFSMFFICATLTGLALYFSMKTYAGSTPQGEITEKFIKHYYVILQCVLLPFYSLLTWSLFRQKNFNYAEALVLTVYTLSFVLLLMIPINMINFIPHHIETTFVEVPVMLIYFGWTHLRFFDQQPAWRVILKTLVMLLIGFVMFQFLANEVMQWMMK